MNLEKRIHALCRLGDKLKSLTSSELEELATLAQSENPWFTASNVISAVKGLSKFLEEIQLRSWVQPYQLNPSNPKKVAVVMAGNIPMVGFNDLLCVLLSGHQLLIKFSSKDSALLKSVLRLLFEIEPAFKNLIKIAENQLKDFDAVIATGSDNTARYFEQYFAKYPHIIRKNRTSCAVLTGKETDEELSLLGTDVFTYFGMGCRNVSKLYIPEHYELSKLGDLWQSFSDTVNHHKYANNYDYQKAILLVNQVKHLDFGYLLVQESEQLVSPIAVLFYESYSSEDSLINRIIADRNKLQCIVGTEPFCTVKFGQAQFPRLEDYADNVDTLQFLSTL